MADVFKFWDERHTQGQATWHKSDVHRLITDYTSDLDLTPPKRVFIPLCGRCLELMWFYEKGLTVVGVEMIEAPVKQFFEENELPYVVKNLSGAKLYETEDERLKIYVCSLYDIDVSEVGKFDVVWDRGSLTAIEKEDRDKYSKLLKALLNSKFAFLLATFYFDDKYTTNPIPKNVSPDETNRLFGEWCDIKVLATINIPEEKMLKLLKTDKMEEIYILLTPK